MFVAVLGGGDVVCNVVLFFCWWLFGAEVAPTGDLIGQLGEGRDDVSFCRTTSSAHCIIINFIHPGIPRDYHLFHRANRKMIAITPPPFSMYRT